MLHPGSCGQLPCLPLSPMEKQECALTCQSTRTHNSRRRLRRKCWWSGHFYVIGRRRPAHARVSRVGFPTSSPMSFRTVSLAAVHFSGGCGSPSVRCTPAPGPGSCAFHFGVAAPRSKVSLQQSPHYWGGGFSEGLARRLAWGKLRANTHRPAMFSPYNKSANTDPQLQEAASPQGLWSGCLQRYLAT